MHVMSCFVSVQTICLPEPGMQYRGTFATAVGFGRFAPGLAGQQSKIKRYVRLKVASNTYWNEKIFGTYIRPQGSEHVPIDVKDACAGDSGG